MLSKLDFVAHKRTNRKKLFAFPIEELEFLRPDEEPN
jgi:hypothetical protein